MVSFFIFFPPPNTGKDMPLLYFHWVPQISLGLGLGLLQIWDLEGENKECN